MECTEHKINLKGHSCPSFISIAATNTLTERNRGEERLQLPIAIHHFKAGNHITHNCKQERVNVPFIQFYAVQVTQPRH